MNHWNRREIVVSGALAAAAFGFGGQVAIAAPGGAPAQGFFRFRLGEATVTTVSDGSWEKPHDPSFIKNASVDDVKASLRAAGASDAAIPIPFTLTFVEVGGRTVMFDAGTGGQLAPTAGKLQANLTAAGIDASKIDAVIVTHFHPDHIFGLMAKDTNEQVYPNAEIIVPEAEYAFWIDPGVFSKVPQANHGLAKRIQATFPQWKNLRRIADGEVALPGITAHAAYGHTPGHTVFHIASGDAEMMNLADTSNIPALFVRNPGWHAAFDADPQAAEANRRRLFDRAIADNLIITGYHYGIPGAGRIAKDGADYAYTPLSAS